MKMSANQDKLSAILKTSRQKYLQKNPMTMTEIDQEIQDYRREKADQDSKTLKEIQSMFANNKGWDSEESMINDMAAFRRERMSSFKEQE